MISSFVLPAKGGDKAIQRELPTTPYIGVFIFETSGHIVVPSFKLSRYKPEKSKCPKVYPFNSNFPIMHNLPFMVVSNCTKQLFRLNNIIKQLAIPQMQKSISRRS